MNYLLAPDHVSILDELARSKVLLAFDFDGTLAPIVAERDTAAMAPMTARLFAEVCEAYPTAVISGRSRSDVAARLGGARAKHIVGNHGLELGDLAEPAAGDIAEPAAGDIAEPAAGDIAVARKALERALAEWRGVDIEDKGFSLAIHYREAPHQEAARAAIHRALSAVPGELRLIPGKLVVNVVPKDAPHKGRALLELMRAEGTDRAFFAGDDATDEDVFELDDPGRIVTVRIGESQASRARYHVREQREIDVVLSRLLSLREAAASR